MTEPTNDQKAAPENLRDPMTEQKKGLPEVVAEAFLRVAVSKRGCVREELKPHLQIEKEQGGEADRRYCVAVDHGGRHMVASVSVTLSGDGWMTTTCITLHKEPDQHAPTFPHCWDHQSLWPRDLSS